MLLVHHGDCLLHNAGAGHPERPERLTSIVGALGSQYPQGVGSSNGVEWKQADEASHEDLCEVHDSRYVDSIFDLNDRDHYAFDADTFFGPGSKRAALLAAGAGVLAARELSTDRFSKAFCIVRPPGHHARPAQAMGFCIFNNIAVTAGCLRRDHGVGRILVLDWDVHHGNGTQEIFYQDPGVLFVSLHQFPFYPGSGRATEVGVGDGKGMTINVPLPAGAGDDLIKDVLLERIEPAIKAFRPEFVLLSAGFDAHADDPLGGLEVTDEGFAWMTDWIAGVAADHCNGKLVSFLEGGYNLDSLARCASVHVRRLSSPGRDSKG